MSASDCESAHDKVLAGYLKRYYSISKLVVHLFFTTNYRRKSFDGAMIDQIRQVFLSAAEKLEIKIF